MRVKPPLKRRLSEFAPLALTFLGAGTLVYGASERALLLGILGLLGVSIGTTVLLLRFFGKVD